MPPRRLRPLAFLAVLLGAFAARPARAAEEASAPKSVTFAFEDERFLGAKEHDGGLAHLTPGVVDDGRVPLVVYLHGLNDYGPVHYWYGLFNKDLRALANELVEKKQVRPFVLAAPSQTRNASNPYRLWDGFDLDAFVEATEAALPDGVEIDRDAIVVVGHSGGGCNLGGGLLGTLDPGVVNTPAAWLSIDSCLDATIGARLGALPRGTMAWAFYQPYTWDRDFDGFSAAFLAELDREPGRDGRIVLDKTIDADPHNSIVERSLRTALPVLLPPPPPHGPEPGEEPPSE